MRSRPRQARRSNKPFEVEASVFEGCQVLATEHALMLDVDGVTSSGVKLGLGASRDAGRVKCQLQCWCFEGAFIVAFWSWWSQKSVVVIVFLGSNRCYYGKSSDVESNTLPLLS